MELQLTAGDSPIAHRTRLAAGHRMNNDPAGGVTHAAAFTPLGHRAQTAFVPDAGNAFQRVEHVAAVVERDLRDRRFFVGKFKLAGLKFVVVLPLSGEFVQHAERSDPHASALRVCGDIRGWLHLFPDTSNARVQRRGAWRVPCCLSARAVTRERARCNALFGSGLAMNFTSLSHGHRPPNSPCARYDIMPLPTHWIRTTTCRCSEHTTLPMHRPKKVKSKTPFMSENPREYWLFCALPFYHATACGCRRPTVCD